MTTELAKKPKPKSSLAEQELDRLETQFDNFSDHVNKLTLDRMNEAPKLETEEQTKLSQKQIQNMDGIVLKPVKSIGSPQKFNERFRAEYEFAKEYVNFIAENNEVIGEEIDIWTLPYGGMPAEEWKVPTNKPVWGPRYLAEQIKRKSYHRLSMSQTANPYNSAGTDQVGSYYGQVVVDNVVQRLDARPVSTRKTLFFGSTSF